MSLSTVVDWLTFRAVTPVTKVRSYINLPAFSYSNTWIGASEIITQFNFSASKNFVLRNRPIPPTGVNFCLCIRWRTGQTVYRWKLWQNVGEVLNVPLYNGELIKKNFVLEVWTTNTATISLSEDLRTLTSVVSVPTDFRSLDMTALATGVEYNKASVALPVYAAALPTTDLLFHYEADSGVTYDGSNNVTAWADQSATGANLGIVGGFFNPVYSASSAEFNNKPIVQFIAGSPMRNTGLALTKLTQTFCVLRQRTWGANKSIFQIGATTNWVWDVYQKNGGVTPEVEVQTRTGDSVITDSNIPVGASAAPRILDLYRNGANSIQVRVSTLAGAVLSINNVDTGSAVTGNVERVVIGNNTPATALVDIAELIGYQGRNGVDGVQNDTSSIIQYLVEKYSSGAPILSLNQPVPSGNAWLSNDKCLCLENL